MVARPRDENRGKSPYLACSQQANACRKLGLGGEAERTSGGLRAIPTRQPREGRRGLIGRRRFGRGKRRHWLVVCGKCPWFRLNPATLRWFRGRAARQEAPEVRSIIPREAEQAEGGGKPRGLRPRSGRRRMDTALQLARAVPNAAPLEPEMPSWLLRSRRRGRSRTRAGKAAGEMGRTPKRRTARREPCARERGFPRVLVKTDRLQRLVRGIFSPAGRRRASVGGTTGSSDAAAAVTVTGRQ